MKDEEVLKLMLEAGPEAAGMFEQWMMFKYYDLGLTFLSVTLFISLLGYVLYMIEKDMFR